MQAAEEAKRRLAEMEAALAIESGEREKLDQEIAASHGRLEAAEKAGIAESQRADVAAERAVELERQVVALRREADEYRAVALKLTQSVTELVNPRQPLAIRPNTPWDDFAQRDPASFDVVADDNIDGTAASDTTRIRTGRQSLRVSAPNGGVCVTYPKSRDANWDLSKYDYLMFALSIEDARAEYRDDGLAGLRSLVLDGDNAPNGIAVLEGVPLRSVEIRVREANKPIQDSFFESLRIFPDLSEVSLRGTAIDAKVIKHFCRIEPMKTLSMTVYPYNPGISTGALKGLAGAANLEAVAIQSRVALSDANLKELATLTKLKSIDLRDSVVEPAKVLELQQSLPNCTVTADAEIQKLLDEARQKK